MDTTRVYTRTVLALLPLELRPTHDENSGARTIAPLGESYLRNSLHDNGRRSLRSLLGVFFAKHLVLRMGTCSKCFRRRS